MLYEIEYRNSRDGSYVTESHEGPAWRVIRSFPHVKLSTRLDQAITQSARLYDADVAVVAEYHPRRVHKTGNSHASTFHLLKMAIPSNRLIDILPEGEQ